jgi:hypothetical protein
MFMSRQLEKPPRTKFKKNQPEEIVDKQKKKQNQKAQETRRRGFDMWEDEPDGSGR